MGNGRNDVSYVVNWRDADGQAGWYPVDSVAEAAAHVEHLRNAEGINETKIFRLSEVAFEVKTYVKIEIAEDPAPLPAGTSFSATIAPEPAGEPVGEAADGAAPSWPAGESAPSVASPVSPSVAEPVAVQVGAGDTSADGHDASANGQRRGLFGR